MNVYCYIITSLLCLTHLAHGQALTKEQNTIAQTLLGEARGEGKAGMYGVACVIKQRINSKHWPSTASKVCLQASQFDYWTSRSRVKWDDQNRANVRRLMKGDSELVRYAKMLAININRLDLSYTKNADHYCTLDTHTNWTKGQKSITIIKNHKFYKLK